ncbi:MAG: response regulator [Proteobacteria bacterium]|nr:response regulator [Pseudomonadota bacterium]
MPAPLDFRKVKIHLIVFESGTRRMVRDLLRSIGFEDVILGSEFEAVRIAITENRPDLLILGSSFPDGDVVALIKDLRHNKLGKDPFLPVITLTSEATEELVGAVADSGSDDLLVYPLSAGHLLKRIEALVEKRKPFVVTRDYIGPDRRGVGSFKEGPMEVPLIDAPNALRATVKGDMSRQELDAAIASTRNVVNSQRLDRSGYQIAWLIKRIIAGYSSGTGGLLEPKVADFLDQLIEIGGETTKRIAGTGFEHVSYLCETLISVSARMLAAGQDADEKDKALLPELGNAFKTAFVVADDDNISMKIRDTLKKPPSKKSGSKKPGAADR